MVTKMDEKYQEICDYVCELFGREEDADQLKEDLEVKPVSEVDESLRDHSEDGLVLNLTNIYSHSEKLIVYHEEALDQEMQESTLKHEIGHALYHLHVPRDTRGPSEVFADVAGGKGPNNRLQVKVGEDLLDGKSLENAVESNFSPSISTSNITERKCKRFAVHKRLREEYGEDLPEVLGDALENKDVNFDSLENFYQSMVENY